MKHALVTGGSNDIVIFIKGSKLFKLNSYVFMADSKHHVI